MSHRAKRIRCKHCGHEFVPDYRNRDRQKYCSKPECRKAGKADSQRRWLQKPRNRDYFRSSVHVQRVQEWRKTHPGYWRRKRTLLPDALQDSCENNPPQNQDVPRQISPQWLRFITALQDSSLAQPAVIVGIVSHLLGSALQEDIDFFLRKAEQRGLDILNPQRAGGGISRDPQVSRMPRSSPRDPQAVQLGRSASDP